MQDYELVMILSPQADDEQIAAAIEGVTSFITEHGGNVSDQLTWGQRRLAYPIRRFQEGYYVITQFGLAPENVLELDRSLRTSEDVLRHLLIKTDPRVK